MAPQPRAGIVGLALVLARAPQHGRYPHCAAGERKGWRGTDVGRDNINLCLPSLRPTTPPSVPAHGSLCLSLPHAFVRPEPPLPLPDELAEPSTPPTVTLPLFKAASWKMKKQKRSLWSPVLTHLT